MIITCPHIDDHNHEHVTSLHIHDHDHVHQQPVDQVHEEDDEHHGQPQARCSHLLGSRRKGDILSKLMKTAKTSMKIIFPLKHSLTIEGDGVRHCEEDRLNDETLFWSFPAQSSDQP